MSKDRGQPIVVEAKPGAGSTIAADAVAKAPADGYTMLLVTGGHAVAGALYRSLPYQTVDGFEMISTATFFPFLIIALLGGETQFVIAPATAALGQIRSGKLRAPRLPVVRSKFEEIGGDLHASTPAEMRARVASELQNWTKVIREAHIERQ